MRTLEEKLAKIHGRPVQKMNKFNLAEQKAYFDREDVRIYFMEHMPLEIRKKIKKNNEKIKECEGHIREILDSVNGNKNEYARNLINKYFSSSQLPWSFEMFEDIKIFALTTFREFVY